MTKPVEKRKFPRIKTDNLITYICIDENDSETDQGVGRALDISQGGILLESHSPIDSERILISTVNENNDLMEIKGKIAYCKESGPGIFQIGVQFAETNDKIREIVVGMIKAYTLSKNK